ncbi:N-acetylmuramoyl-L-alanine amidase [Streptomyces sp. MUM 178J]|uniref:N-acetylmuramoyl-L-alanine amidase n=1 Tax=Streptomyces sp. MUM 178J TaxID=2791991 RepID=UPI001F0388C0|nr:N-acetylmuramoyl-L-alanine amidase [Streptomyces sp. MUM 178J]WRQ79710.1 N-acetylmuramoyl-L-alanine amidase [Streptomyces sp. MUM 178J]
MRGNLASSSISIACSAALALPLTLSSALVSEAAAASQPPASDESGYTQSLPLKAARPTDRSAGPAGAAEQGLTERDVRTFSLVGVVWEDERAELHGTVQVRTRAVATGAWSSWQDVETHNHEHAADRGTAEGDSERVRGATAPLWVGESDGVEVRVRAEDAELAPLPEGLRLELVEPGSEPLPKGRTGEEDEPGDAVGAVDGPEPDGGFVSVDIPGLAESVAAAASQLVLPALSQEETEAQAEAGVQQVAMVDAAAAPFIGPRPAIVTRAGWGADESLRESGFLYTSTIKAAFVHHTATGNNYTCSEAPSVIRSIYRYHTQSMGWRDIGYNFTIDKCGKIYEGRAGGVAKPVMGAHTLGFNSKTTGIAVLGTYSSTNPPSASVTAVAKLTAWKLGLHGADPSGKVVLTSGGSGKYAKGVNVNLHVISGHRDGYNTDCPGGRLYNMLGTARSVSAAYQGR